MTKTTLLIGGCVLLVTASLAGLLTMIALLTKPPAAEVPFADGGGGHIQVDCRSIVDAADAEDTEPSDDQVTDVDALGETKPANDRPQLAWCADERTARAALMALLAVPTTVAGAGSLAAGLASRTRRASR